MVKNCTFSLDPDTIVLIEKLAATYGASKSGVVRRAVKAWSEMLTLPLMAQTVVDVTPTVPFSTAVHTGVRAGDDKNDDLVVQNVRIDKRVAARDCYFLWTAMEFMVHRYLICNSGGRLDGVEKSSTHTVLVQIYVGAALMQPPESILTIDDKFAIVHKATQTLTDYMDTEIGFPLKGRPNYDKLAPRFFRRFLELASAALPFTLVHTGVLVDGGE